MNTYQKIANELKNENLLNYLYRFQGGKSFECFDIKLNKFNKNQEGKYVYFSSNESHHKYFTIRRLRQLINNVVLINTDLNLCTKQLYNIEQFYRIIQLIENSEKIDSIYSLKLLHDPNFTILLKQNCFKTNEKNSNCIERVDRRVYNGGYGISNEWLELLELMTFFTAYYKISPENIIELIQNMRKTGRINSINNINFLFENSYNLRINPNVFNDFVKYQIMNLLEQIIEKNMTHPASNLINNPSSTIKEILNGYEKNREKTLKLIDKNYKNITK